MIVKKQLLTKDRTIDPQQRKATHQLVLAWAIILGGCLVSFWNWHYLANAAGDYQYLRDERFAGWSQSFFVSKPGTIILNSARWLTCFLKAIGTIGAGLILLKLRHKQAVSIAFICVLFSFPLFIIAFPFKGNHLTLADVVDDEDLDVLNSYAQPSATVNSLIGYYLFLSFRSFLAVGTGMLVVCTQPILSELRKISQIKSIRFNSLATYGALIMGTFPFLLGSSLHDLLVKYWYVFSGLLMLMISCLLLLYLIFAEDLKTVPGTPIHNETFNQRSLGVIRDLNTWKLGCLVGVLTFLILFPSSSAMKSVIQTSFANLAISSNAPIWLGNWSLSLEDVWKLWQIYFVLGGIVGYFFIASFSQTKYQRHGFLIFNAMVGFMFLILSLIFGYNGYNYPLRLWFHLLFMFLAGIFLWGCETVILTIPHELSQNQPGEVSLMVGLILGISSTFYAVFDCSLSLIDDLNTISPCLNSCGNYTRPTNVLVFVIFLSSIFFLLFFLWLLPDTGSYAHDRFYVHKQCWRIWNWNFSSFKTKIIQNPDTVV